MTQLHEAEYSEIDEVVDNALETPKPIEHFTDWEIAERFFHENPKAQAYQRLHGGPEYQKVVGGDYDGWYAVYSL